MVYPDVPLKRLGIFALNRMFHCEKLLDNVDIIVAPVLTSGKIYYN